MKLAIGSLMLLAATTVISLPTPDQAQPDSCIIVRNEVDGSIEKRCNPPLQGRAAKEASCIIVRNEVDGTVEKRCNPPLQGRAAKEASCIIVRNEVDGTVEKRCNPPLKARSEEVSNCIARKVDGVVEKRDPIPGTQNCI